MLSINENLRIPVEALALKRYFNLDTVGSPRDKYSRPTGNGYRI